MLLAQKLTVSLESKIPQMIIEIDNKIISTEIFENKFVCDLNACKGACCVKGDAGAPVTLEEIDILENELENIKPFLRPEGIEMLEKSGVFYVDTTNEMVTTLVNNAECAFAVFDTHGIAKCGIEDAYNAGKTTFKKPISCHLYPIRLQKYRDFTAVNYHQWSVCKPAVKFGNKEGVRLYQFLKEPLIRKFGEEWYSNLEDAAKMMEENK